MNSLANEAISSSSSSTSSSKWKSTFSPISDPKQPPPDLRQGGSPFSIGGTRGGATGTDSDSDHKQQQQRRGEGGVLDSLACSQTQPTGSPYLSHNPFLSQEAGGRPGGPAAERQPKQKPREWDLKAPASLATENLFISAAANSGILTGKVGNAVTAGGPGASVGQYLGTQFPLGGTSVLQSPFGSQTPAPAVTGAPRLLNGHSALGTFSSTGLAGGAAGGESFARAAPCPPPLSGRPAIAGTRL